MARAFILSPKNSDAGSISASNSIANAGASNLLLARPKAFWRSSTTTPYIEGTLSSIADVDTAVLGFTNGRTQQDPGAVYPPDTMRLVLAASVPELTSNPIYNSGDFNIWPSNADFSAYAKVHRVFTFPVQSSVFAYRAYFSYSNLDGYVQASRFILGKRIEPIVSVAPGWSIGGTEDVVETVDMGGEESPREVGVRRSQTVTWKDLTEAERESLYTTLLERGSAKDIVLAIESSEGRYAMSRVHIGRVKQAFSFPQTVGIVNEPEIEHHYTVSLTVTEMAPIEMV